MARKHGPVHHGFGMSNKLFYTLVVLVSVGLLTVGVRAWVDGETPNPGHSIQSVGAPSGCASGQVLQYQESGGSGGWTCTATTDTNADTECSGNNVFYDGNCNCRDLTTNYGSPIHGDLIQSDTLDGSEIDESALDCSQITGGGGLCDGGDADNFHTGDDADGDISMGGNNLQMNGGSIDFGTTGECTGTGYCYGSGGTNCDTWDGDDESTCEDNSCYWTGYPDYCEECNTVGSEYTCDTTSYCYWSDCEGTSESTCKDQSSCSWETRSRKLGGSTLVYYVRNDGCSSDSWCDAKCKDSDDLILGGGCHSSDGEITDSDPQHNPDGYDEWSCTADTDSIDHAYAICLDMG